MVRPTDENRLKEPVRVRYKQLSNGSKSVYLDIYHNGRRQYEFLKLYILPEINANVREQNKVTMAAVNKIKSLRIIEITNGKAGLRNTAQRSRMLLTDWLDTFAEKQKRKGVRGTNLLHPMIRIVRRYDSKVRMGQLNKEWVLGFMEYLRSGYKTSKGTALKASTQADYIGYFSTALNAAVRAEIIPDNPFNQITSQDRPKVPESSREFLTIDEIRSLMATPCRNEIVKSAYLFACNCGLRFGDISRMRWKDLNMDGEQWRLTMVMQKTSAPIYLPISRQAMKWIPERGIKDRDDDPIFYRLPSISTVEVILKEWVKTAGISKHITFHTSRHTFATMMLTLGADLYTTSKLLGHSRVTTTQIYAKIIDKKKDDAINLIDEAFK